MIKREKGCFQENAYYLNSAVDSKFKLITSNEYESEYETASQQSTENPLSL